MKTIILLLLSITTFSQNLIINSGDVITINSNYDNISFHGKGKLIVNNNVRINNLNSNGKAYITVSNGAKFDVQSSINLNGDTLLNNGEITCSALEIQNGKGYFYNTGKLTTTQSDAQINSKEGIIKNCGQMFIKQSFNINSGSYISCNCGTVESYGINPNGNIEGQGTFKFQQINLNKTFTLSPNIYVYYTGVVNNHKLWGNAILNSPTGCNSALPVKLSLFKVGRGRDENGREIIIINTRFEDLDKIHHIRIQRSSNGKDFTTVKEVGRNEFKLNEIQTFTVLK